MSIIQVRTPERRAITDSKGRDARTKRKQKKRKGVEEGHKKRKRKEEKKKVTRRGPDRERGELGRTIHRIVQREQGCSPPDFLPSTNWRGTNRPVPPEGVQRSVSLVATVGGDICCSGMKF